MSSEDDSLREAMAAHKAGHFSVAETGYRRVLRVRPSDPKALYYLGLLHFHRGETQPAIELMQQCLQAAPSSAHAWNTLGGLLVAAGRKSEATEAYRRLTLAAPEWGEGWYNYAVCLRDAGSFEAAVGRWRDGIARQPDFFKSYDALASLLYRLGRLPEAQAVYRDWSIREPQNPVARHMTAAVSQQDVPPRAADDYVRSLFDSSADTFDLDIQRLGYNAPRRVAEALKMSRNGRILAAVLDAGCGTGLCGPLLREQCTMLAGVDLSAQMIDRARARLCYDELELAELSAFMRSRPSSFDAIVSADTLVYFGALEEPLDASRTALREPGVLIFTLEAAPSSGVSHYRLEPHGRYVHEEHYVRQAVQAAGLQVQTFTRDTLREERGQPVQGFLIVALYGQAV